MTFPRVWCSHLLTVHSCARQIHWGIRIMSSTQRGSLLFLWKVKAERVERSERRSGREIHWSYNTRCKTVSFGRIFQCLKKTSSQTNTLALRFHALPVERHRQVLDLFVEYHRWDLRKPQWPNVQLEGYRVILRIKRCNHFYVYNTHSKDGGWLLQMARCGVTSLSFHVRFGRVWLMLK